MSPRVLSSFMFIFMVGIFTSNSFPPSLALDSFITCWVLELVEHDELTTSFKEKSLATRMSFSQLAGKKRLSTTMSFTKLFCSKRQWSTFRLISFRTRSSRTQITTWSAQLQQNLCENKKLVTNPEIDKTSFQKHGIFKVTSLPAPSMRSLRKTACTQKDHAEAHLEEVQLHELQLSKPFEEQQQKEELEKNEQLVDSKILVENQLENVNFEQRVPNRQLQQNLSQAKKQLQNSNQEQILLQQLSFENSYGKEKNFNNELATNFENKQSFESAHFLQLSKGSVREELAFQSSLFGSLDFQMNFSASKGLAEKNFLNKQFLQNSLGKTAAGACKEQLPATCLTRASDNEQLSEQLVAAEGRQRSFPPRTFTSLLSKSRWEERTSSRTPLKRTACRQELLQHQLPDSSFTEETFSKTPSQRAAWQKRASESNFSDSSLEDETFSTAASEESSLERFSEQLRTQQLRRQLLRRAASKRAAWKRAASKRAA